MNIKRMTASLASKAFRKYLTTVQHEPVVVTKNNKPVAVTLSFKDAQEFFDYKVEQSIKYGLDDVENGRHQKLTSLSAVKLKTEFKAQTS